jgi:carbonic anhydrase
MSVFQYAVEYLLVKHVIVCGHYGCGGVKAAMSTKSFGVIDYWLSHMKDLMELHEQDIKSKSTLFEKEKMVVELNVRRSVKRLAQSPITKKARENHRSLILHGWCFGYFLVNVSLSDGVIRKITKM